MKISSYRRYENRLENQFRRDIHDQEISFQFLSNTKNLLEHLFTKNSSFSRFNILGIQVQFF